MCGVCVCVCLQKITACHSWSFQSWHDIVLKWDPADFGGVAEVRVPVSEIWTPDIVLYN